MSLSSLEIVMMRQVLPAPFSRLMRLSQTSPVMPAPTATKLIAVSTVPSVVNPNVTRSCLKFKGIMHDTC